MDSTETSHQPPSHYTSLVNPGTFSHNYTELMIARKHTSNSSPSGSNQHHPLVNSNVISQDNQNTMPHQVQRYTALIRQTEATTHSYAELIRPEMSSRKSTSNSEQRSKVYSTVVRQDNKKVTVKFAISDPPEEIHQIENQASAEGNSDLAKENITSHSSKWHRTAPTDRAARERTMYSTVVRQGGKKVTIRTQAPMEEQDPW